MHTINQELVVLLNKMNQPIGTYPKDKVHTNNTPLHLAFSCYIFDDRGNLLLTQRAHRKSVWPSVWTNSFCGHPLPDEALEDAIRRRASFELNIQVHDIILVLPNYRYTTPPYNGIIENEFCPVYFAKIPNNKLKIAANTSEVESYRWISILELRTAIAKEPDAYSYWIKDQLLQLEKVLP